MKRCSVIRRTSAMVVAFGVSSIAYGCALPSGGSGLGISEVHESDAYASYVCGVFEAVQSSVSVAQHVIDHDGLSTQDADSFLIVLQQPLEPLVHLNGDDPLAVSLREAAEYAMGVSSWSHLDQSFSSSAWSELALEVDAACVQAGAFPSRIGEGG